LRLFHLSLGGANGESEQRNTQRASYGYPVTHLDNAAQAIDWYKKALAAEETARAVGPDGKIMHAEIRIGDSLSC